MNYSKILSHLNLDSDLDINIIFLHPNADGNISKAFFSFSFLIRMRYELLWTYSNLFFILFPDKSVSFEKSVSFSDDIQGLPKTHSPHNPGKSMSLKITAVWKQMQNAYKLNDIKLYYEWHCCCV